MSDRINEEYMRIRTLCANAHPKDYTGLFMAQQALAWALDPSQAAAPSELIAGTPEGSEDCCHTFRPELSEHEHG